MPWPRLAARHPSEMWPWQVDAAAGRLVPSHTARNTVHYLQHKNVQFTEPNLWPPNSPDLNPVDLGFHSADGLPSSKFCLSWRSETSDCWGMAETTTIIHRQERRWMVLSSGLRSETEWRTHWTHVQLTCKVLILVRLRPVLLLWVCFVRLVTYYSYCHLLDGAILFSKVDLN